MGPFVTFSFGLDRDFTGLLYFTSGILTQHFRNQLFPAPASMSWPVLRATALDHLRLKRPVDQGSYNIFQRLAYLAVILLLFPMMIVTGFAMSPAITSVVPQFVTVFGGQQTARTLHFFLTMVLVLFVLVHVAMVILAGFAARIRAMITGRAGPIKERS